MPKMLVKALVPLFGSNRMLAAEPAKFMTDAKWIGVVFAGGMSELAYLKARTMVVNDLHRHIMNLATVVACPSKKDELVALLEATPFHPDALVQAQKACSQRETEDHSALGNLSWARDYFVAAWMSRNGTAGTKKEFSGGLSVRWEAAGGDSAVRFRNATASLAAWYEVMRRCTFRTDDCFAFLDSCWDKAGHVLYCDPPFPGPGDGYKYSFDTAAHYRLARRLAQFEHTRVVCRFYEVPMIRQLYPERRGWVWHRFTGRKQTNALAPELLLVRN